MEWISVEDELPEKESLILIYDSTAVFDTAKIRRIKYINSDKDWFKKAVTHWMPLPEPPKL